MKILVKENIDGETSYIAGEKRQVSVPSGRGPVEQSSGVPTARSSTLCNTDQCRECRQSAHSTSCAAVVAD